MSIFDDNIKNSLDNARKVLMKEIQKEFMIGTCLLSKEEICSLLNAISFAPNETNSLYPRGVLRADVVVIISENEEYYDGPSHVAKLGQHCLNNPAYDGRETIEISRVFERMPKPIMSNQKY